MPKAMSSAEFITKAMKLHAGRYTYDRTVYTKSQSKVTITCPKHGDFTALANNHISKSNLCGCPRCGKTGVFTYDAFIIRAQAVHGGYTYDAASYVNTNTPMRICCAEHGWFTQTPTRHMGGRGCHTCGGTIRQSLNQILRRCVAVHADKYGYHLVPADARLDDTVPIVCPKHGVFHQVLKRHCGRGYGCGRCSGRVSTGEREVSAYIQSLGVSVQHNRRKLLGGMEVDVYVPALRIGFEYHGAYWHSDNRVGAGYHRAKWEAAQVAGIQLVQIFDDEWRDSESIVKARIAALLGQGPKYDARKCEVHLCKSQEASAFLNTTHIQGSSKSSHYYGLYSAGVLVAVASFGKSRSGAMTGTMEPGAWEVMRYASTGRVRGGFSRLLAQFKKDVQPAKIISYCDLRYGDGRLYSATGFTLESITPPDYWWLSAGGNVRVARYTTQKHKLKDHPVLGKFYAPEKSEGAICAAAGWEKIHGVGHQRWVWNMV